MTPKQIALRKTLIVCASGLGFGFVVGLIFSFLTVPQIGIVACLALLALGVNFVYKTELARAEFEEKIGNKG